MSAHLAGRRPVYAGMWYDNSVIEPSVARTNAAVHATGFAIYVPFLAPRDFTVADIAVVCTVAQAASTVRLGIYTDDGACTPGTLLVDAGDVSTASTGLRAAGSAGSVTLYGGRLYWLATQVSNGSVQLQVPATAGTPFLGLINGTDANTIKRAYNTQTYGAFPATPGAAVTRDSTITAPSVLLKAA